MKIIDANYFGEEVCEKTRLKEKSKVLLQALFNRSHILVKKKLL